MPEGPRDPGGSRRASAGAREGRLRSSADPLRRRNDSRRRRHNISTVCCYPDPAQHQAPSRVPSPSPSSRRHGSASWPLRSPRTRISASCPTPRASAATRAAVRGRDDVTGGDRAFPEARSTGTKPQAHAPQFQRSARNCDSRPRAARNQLNLLQSLRHQESRPSRSAGTVDACGATDLCEPTVCGRQPPRGSAAATWRAGAAGTRHLGQHRSTPGGPRSPGRQPQAR